MADANGGATVTDAVIAVAKAIEANAVALMGASNALEVLMEHIRNESAALPIGAVH